MSHFSAAKTQDSGFLYVKIKESVIHIGSNPAEAVGFFGAKKSSARLPSEGQ
jgi:hypothetical protein